MHAYDFPSTGYTTIYPHTCTPDSMWCDSYCVPRSWFCDGEEDCSGGTDEPADCQPMSQLRKDISGDKNTHVDKVADLLHHRPNGTQFFRFDICILVLPLTCTLFLFVRLMLCIMLLFNFHVLGHLAYQPKSLIQSCFVCRHWHWHLCTPLLATGLNIETCAHMSLIYTHQIFSDSDL